MNRSPRTSLGQIVLGFELIVVFLAALVLSGLQLVSLLNVVLGASVVLALMILAIIFMRYSFSFVLGWISQILIIATGFVLPMLFIVGIIFTALWAFAMIMGSRLESQKGSAS